MARLHPSVDASRLDFDAPVVRVMVLEDRALVRRQGRVKLESGRQRLAIHGVSPVLQDVSLQAEVRSGPGQVADVFARRAWRIVEEDRPEDAVALEREIERRVQQIYRWAERRTEAEMRQGRIHKMVAQASQEIPDDAAWGRSDPDTWKSTFSTLFARGRAAAMEDLEGYHAQLDLKDEVENLVKQRAALDRLDTDFVGWLGVDVDIDGASEVELAVEYIVPCALWRPVHRARWAMGQQLAVTTSAALWQNTGEDWTDVELLFSTSRASLGHEPPHLVDDPLEAERKDEEIEVETRDVEVQVASVEESRGGGGPPARDSETVQLPGVDDGGQRREIAAPGRHEVPANGRPVRVPLAGFVTEAHGELVTMPEQREVAVWRVVARQSGADPLLAGPVELVRGHGPVGWTETRFVAPGAPLELGFGPDEAVRVERTEEAQRLERRADEWLATRQEVSVYLSNLADVPRRVKVTERIPVSEIDDVRVTLDGDSTTGGHTVDDDGFVTWEIDLEAYATEALALRYVVTWSPQLDWAF